MKNGFDGAPMEGVCVCGEVGGMYGGLVGENPQGSEIRTEDLKFSD